MSELEAINKRIDELKLATIIQFKDVLTVEEAAMYTGMSKRTLYDYTSRGQIPCYKSRGGKTTYFKKEDLISWMLHTPVATADAIQSEASRIIYR